MFENRKYVIIPTSEIDCVDYDELIDTDRETSACCPDRSRTIIEFEGRMPVSIKNIEGRSRAYSHAEILEIVSTPWWTDNPFQE